MISPLSGTIILIFIEILENERIVFNDMKKNNAQVSFVYMILIELIKYECIAHALHLGYKTLNLWVFKSKGFTQSLNLWVFGFSNLDLRVFRSLKFSYISEVRSFELVKACGVFQSLDFKR